uniref:FERM and PDZ domain containing 1 n=1 Tax=Salvator merianae TaxID=96440 RepID=A0A8D0CBG7_SALMN
EEEEESSLFFLILETRKAHRIEQMVAKWLRRSRDNSISRTASMTDKTSDGISQPASHVKLTVDVQKDTLLGHYGFEVSQNLPLLITSVAAVKVFGLFFSQGAPKSSFLTAEKRARLKTNPAKVRFAEEVVVNGHTQGSSLLCMPNVLKVYLENGQTKAFKFDTNTTVKDIILTLKEKLSIRNIDYFALVLEEQYNVLKMYLLHEDELIEEVSAKYCLFTYASLSLLTWLGQFQSCSDVLQERFAVEMKCSVALRLAALHIQERMIICAQPQKVSLKYIEKDWGIENFISPTLLRNMKGKDIKKAISFHMKRNQLLLDPRQKHFLSAAQVRLCYLQILGDLKLYGGKIFNATLMLQDRESSIVLLVGAKYGISQVVNNKLNIITMLAEFANISRLELTEESEKVSMVKIYLQDLKLLILLLESNSAKDLSCLINGYYRMFVDSSNTIFVWGTRKHQTHRPSMEEGYESRTCSDSEESSELDLSLDHFSDIHSPKNSRIGPLLEKEREQKELEEEKNHAEDKGNNFCNGYDNMNDSLSEASDSASVENQGLKISGSSDSMDALEEDDLETCSTSRPGIFHLCTPTLQGLTSNDKAALVTNREKGSQVTKECFFSFLLPLHSSNPVLALPNADLQKESEMNAPTVESKVPEKNIMEYYRLCANISPASSGEKTTQSDSLEGNLNGPGEDDRICESVTHSLILAPPPGFADTSSDDEFYDAAERVTPTRTHGGGSARNPSGESLSVQEFSSSEVLSHSGMGENFLSKQSKRMRHRPENYLKKPNSLRKRRSFLQTYYTSQVTFPPVPSHSVENAARLVALSFRDPNSDSDLLEAKQTVSLPRNAAPSSCLTEMESEMLQIKSANSIMCPGSAVPLQDTQKSKENPDFTHSSFTDWSLIYSRLPSRQSTGLSMPEVSLQLDGLSATCEQKADFTEMGSEVQEHCVESTGHLTVQLFENTMETTHTVPKTEASYLRIEKTDTTTKSSQYMNSHQGKQLCYTPSSNQDYLPTEKVEKHQLYMCSPCKREDDLILCQSNETSELQKNSSSLQLPEDKKGQGVPNTTDLLSNSDNISETMGSLFLSACCSIVDQSKTFQQTDDKHEIIIGQSNPNLIKFLLNDEILNQGSAMATSENIHVSPKHGDHKPKARLKEKYSYSLDFKPLSPPAVPSGENMDQRKADHSDVLDYFSLDIVRKPTGPREKTSALNKTFFCSDSAAEVDEAPLSPNSMNSSAVFNTKETFSFKHKKDKCDCQLMYRSCFCGLDNEAEVEHTNPIAWSSSEEPLTMPPLIKTPPALLNPTEVTQVRNYVNGNSKDCKNHVWLPESPLKALSYLKDRMHALPFNFCHLLENVIELQEILKQLWGSRVNHSLDKCSAHFSENKNILYTKSQRLMSSCQKVIKIQGPSSETQNAVQETFQNLLELTEVCFQFTNCGLCIRRHKYLVVNLKDVVCSYCQFVHAAKQACEKGYPSFSVRFLVCQYTALTATIFCLMQQFRASSCI